MPGDSEEVLVMYNVW